MRRKILRLSLCLILLASLSHPANGQAASEFRDHPDIPKEWPREPVRAAHGMVATDEPLASQVGADILKHGGNAVDAAVATAFALAVVEPAAGNIGGGGFMLVRLAGGKTTFFDYREMAPGKATRDMYIKPDGKLDEKASTIGYRSVAVPGTVAGLALALENPRHHETCRRDAARHPPGRARISRQRKTGARIRGRRCGPAAVSGEQPHLPERRQAVSRGRHSSVSRFWPPPSSELQKRVPPSFTGAKPRACWRAIWRRAAD